MTRPMVGMIERRLLVNYAVDPDVLRPFVPDVFRLSVVRGSAVAGICLIRLGELRPAGFPAMVGLTSENGAHRVAVEWDGPTGVEQGVYILQRDTASALTTTVGGRLFPGTHQRADFTVAESRDRLAVDYRTRDGRTSVAVRVRLTDELRGSRLFDDVGTASAFFEHSPIGYSPSRTPGELEGLLLRTEGWAVDATVIESVRSTFFEELPAGSAVLDSALVMRGVVAHWHKVPRLQARQPVQAGR